jgi:hypothetical protein
MQMVGCNWCAFEFRRFSGVETFMYGIEFGLIPCYDFTMLR